MTSFTFERTLPAIVLYLKCKTLPYKKHVDAYDGLLYYTQKNVQLMIRL